MLIKAKHDVFGVVEVPETYVDMWPEKYTRVSDDEVADTEREERRSDLMKLTVEQLDEQLEARGLDTGGLKADKVELLLDV